MSRLLMTFAGLSLLAVGAAAGYWLSPQHQMPATAVTAKAEPKVLYWYDPMYPTQQFDQPGPSPFMDMQLVPKYAEQGAGNDGAAASLKIDPQQAQNLGMRTEAVVRGVLPSSFSAVASLAYNQREVARIQARADGFVERVYARAPGDVLSAGAPLVDLLIPQWSAAQLEFIALLDTKDSRLISAGRERLRLLGMPPALIQHVASSRQPRPVQTLSTPIAGELQSLQVRAGMSVTAGQDLATINGLATVWLEAAIPEALAGQIALGEPLQVQLAAYPGQQWTAKVIALLPAVEAQSRTLTLRAELANPKGLLRPGMFATVQVNGGAGVAQLLVPSEALIRSGKRTLLMLAEGEGRYASQEVRVGREADGRSEILQGVSDGQQVVTSGQFLLDSEASLRGIPVRPLSAPAAVDEHAQHHQHGEMQP